MMTPQEVSQHAFAKASFGGYNMAMVDEFLDALTADYTALYKENAVLKSKMKVLVDKLDEYRATDEGMRKAFLLAQKTADDIVAQAELQKAELMKTAEEEARAKIALLRHELESEQYRLTAAQNATAAYVGKLRDLYQNELDYLSNLSRLSAPPPTQVETAAHEIEDSMQRMMDASARTEAPGRHEAPAPPEVPKETMDLDKELEALRVAQPAAAPEQAPATPIRSEGGLYAELLELNITPGQRHTPREPLPDLPADPPGDEAEEDEVEDEDNTSPTLRIDFDNLKFGKDYEIK